MLPTFALHRPATLTAALELLDADAVPYCGGTELLLAMKVGLLQPGALVDVKRIAELGGIEQAAEGTVRIGGAVSHQAVSTSPLVRERMPALAAVAERVGNPRVRAQGSIGGNLCFAEPKSDLAPLLIALGAAVELAGPGGSRTVALDAFIEGPYWTAREERELLACVRVPSGAPAVYLKYQTMERPTLGVALAARESGYRLVLGAACEVPAVYELDSLDVDADDLVADLDVVADLTGSEEYKRHVAAVYVRRAIRRFEQEHGRG